MKRYHKAWRCIPFSDHGVSECYNIAMNWRMGLVSNTETVNLCTILGCEQTKALHVLLTTGVRTLSIVIKLLNKKSDGLQVADRLTVQHVMHSVSNARIH